MTTTLKELLRMLEERLVEHDNNRKEVQAKLQKAAFKVKESAGSMEESVNKEIHEDFDKKEEQILGLIEKLNEGGRNSDALIEQAQEELSKEWAYEIQQCEPEEGFAESHKLKISSVKVGKKPYSGDEDKTEFIANRLREHLDKIQESVTAAQDKLIEVSNERRKAASELEMRINGKLESFFSQEDARIQGVVKLVKEKIGSKDPEEVKELTLKAKVTLLETKKYSLSEGSSCAEYDLIVRNDVDLRCLNFEERKPTDLAPLFTEKGNLSLSFTLFNEVEMTLLKPLNPLFDVEVKTWEKGREEDTSRTLTKEFTLGSDEPISFKDMLSAGTTYSLMTKIEHQGMSTQWGDETEFTTPEFKECCAWKECPDHVDRYSKYSVDEKNPRIATMINGEYDICTIVGNVCLPCNTTTSWKIKILKSKYNDGTYISVGVAPFDIDPSSGGDVRKSCGWYFDCYESVLISGPPHNHWRKEYGPRKSSGWYVQKGSVVGVSVDTAKGELSFGLKGKDLGVAYEGIPLDKPLVPCVVLGFEGDSVELVV